MNGTSNATSLFSANAIHHVGSQHILAARGDRRAFVQEVVEEPQRLASLRLDANLRAVWKCESVVLNVDDRFAAFALVIQVHHERELTPLVVAGKVTINVRPERVAGIVAIEPEAFV